MAKFTLLLTQQCNLRCDYCYIEKRSARMSVATAAKIVDFAFANAAPSETLDIGFFGGEPLLELDLLKAIADLVKDHPDYGARQVAFSVITNGTLLTEEIAETLRAECIQLCISCDGPPEVQDRFRRFADGRPTAAIVERNIRQALGLTDLLRVNAVFHPLTFRQLPQTVAYLAELGVHKIYLNPDFSAPWSEGDLADLEEIYSRVADLYKSYHLAGLPRFISLIDGKIAAIVAGGYPVEARCRMGLAEFAFTPEGRIFPCERLIGDGSANCHCIGNIDDGIKPCGGCRVTLSTLATNAECQDCGLKDYCMRWCGCSNFLATGRYDRVSRFLCASERAAIKQAFSVFQELSESLGIRFLENLGVQKPPLAMTGTRDASY